MWTWLLGPAVLAGISVETGAQLIGLLASIAGSVLVSLVVGYVLGVIPAAITGAICHFFAQTVRSDAAWVAACIVVGAAAGAVMGFVFFQSLALDLAAFALPGAVAAAVCSLSLRRERWL